MLHVIDVATGKDTGDVIDRANFAQSVVAAGRALGLQPPAEACADDAPVTDKYQNQRVYVHQLGDNPDNDTPLFGAGVSPLHRDRPGRESSSSSTRWARRTSLALVVNGVQREAQAVRRAAGRARRRQDAMGQGRRQHRRRHRSRDAWATPVPDVAQGRVALQGAAMSLAKPDIATAEVVVPPGDRSSPAIAAAKDALYVRKMNGGISDLFRLDYARRRASRSDRAAVRRRHRCARHRSAPAGRRVRTSAAGRASAATTPTIPRAARSSTPDCSRRASTTIPADLGRDRGPGEGARRHAGAAVDRAQEGLKLDGSNPTILYGYGAYGISRRRSTGRRGCRGSSAAACSRWRTCAAAASTARTGTRPATRRPSPTRGATRSRAPSG